MGDRRAVALLLSLLAVLVLRTAWLANDAFVDLRVAQNLVDGYGPRWNVDERVQAFADPLWVGALALVHLVVRDAYLACIALSIVLALAAAWLVARRIAIDETAALVGLTVLAFSRGFVEYSTSGFATPLAYAVLIAFAWLYVRMPRTPARIVALTSTAALLLLTLPLAVCLIAPALAIDLGRGDLPMRQRISSVAAGLTPLLAWAIFAFAYFHHVLPEPIGAPAPATTVGASISRGMSYLIDAVHGDPAAAAAILTATFIGWRSNDPLGRSSAAGLALYLVALVAIGGDSLSLRAVAPAALISAVVLVRAQWSQVPATAAIACGIAMALGLSQPAAPLRTDASYGGGRSPARKTSPFIDARLQSYPAFGLLRRQRTQPVPDTWTTEQAILRTLERGETTAVADDAPFVGFVAGHRLHVVPRKQDNKTQRSSP